MTAVFHYPRQILRATWLGLSDPLRRLFLHRFLVLLLLRRDIVARTSGTLLGVGWLLLQPAMQLIGFWFLLDIVLRVKFPGKVPFVDYFLVGMLAWLFVSEVLSRALNVLKEFSGIYRRALFPLMILPLIPLLMSFLMYTTIGLLASLLLAGPTTLPTTLGLYLILALWLMPFCYLLAVAGVFLKDFGQVFPFFITLMLYMTPILYMPQNLPETMRDLLMLNPIADWMALLHGGIQGMAWDWGNLARPWLLWLALLGPAWVLFHRAEPHVRELV